MHRRDHPMLFLPAALWAAAVSRAAEVLPPDEPQMRAAMARSLDDLAREGDRWMNLITP